MPRTLPGSFFLLLLLSGQPVSAAQEEAPAARDETSPRIGALSVERIDGQFVASFRLDSVFDPELQGKIASGLETVFEYRLEVIRRRRFWLDEHTVEHRILASTRYDSLSRQYSLLLKVDGEVERSSTTDKAEEMGRWMTEIQGIPLGPVSGFTPAEDFSVRVKSNLQQRFVLFFIPWNRDTTWVRVPLLGGGAEVHGTGK
jgi:hypothetical protein